MGITNGNLFKRGETWGWKYRVDREVRWESLKVCQEPARYGIPYSGRQKLRTVACSVNAERASAVKHLSIWDLPNRAHQERSVRMATQKPGLNTRGNVIAATHSR